MIVAMSVATACESPAAAPASTGPVVTLANGSKVSIEVVAEPETRAQGLMFRSSLGANHGMLFIFPETAAHSFWMKNTLIPLDIIWIDEAKRIVHVERDVPPCTADPCPSYPPSGVARYVLELAAGEAVARGIRNGDRVVIEGIENFVAH
ncbi:MAG: DUF192 domain-containing protein [Acidobacteria bacterium]|nr:DUF192 domain-containing protein [Acidobacteriota bacterium]